MDMGLNFKKKTNLKFLFFKYTFKWEDTEISEKIEIHYCNGSTGSIGTQTSK